MYKTDKILDVISRLHARKEIEKCDKKIKELFKEITNCINKKRKCEKILKNSKK